MCADRLHADELDIDAELVSRLVAQQFPPWATLPVRPLPASGTVNVLFRLGDDMVVRFPRLPAPAEGLDTEQRWLSRLAPLLPVPVPAPLALGKPAADYPSYWSVYRWLPGTNPVPGRLAEPYALAEDMAAFVTAMRRIDLPDGPAAYRGGPVADHDAGTRRAIIELRAMPELRETIDIDAVTAAWEAALAVPEHSGPPVWLHADLMSGNLLTTNGRLSAVIDFGTVGMGDPACDLIVAWNVLPAGAREAFRSALDVDDTTWARGRNRALFIALIQLPYYYRTNPVMAADSQYTIREVLAEHVRMP